MTRQFTPTAAVRGKTPVDPLIRFWQKVSPEPNTSTQKKIRIFGETCGTASNATANLT